MVSEVMLYVEVAGCPTICQHCWAQGVPYPAMPLADITHVLEQAIAACEAASVAFSAYPMNEVAAHPEGSAVLRLFNGFHGDRSHDGDRALYEPLSTTGVRRSTTRYRRLPSSEMSGARSPPPSERDVPDPDPDGSGALSGRRGSLKWAPARARPGSPGPGVRGSPA